MQTEADRPEAPTAMCNHLGAIFVSLELSRSTWLITSLSPGGGEKCRRSRCAAVMSPDCWSASLNFGRKLKRGRVVTFQSSSFRKQGWTDSGFIACSRMKGSKATLSIRPPSRSHVGVGGRRLTASTARRCFARCWRTSAENLGCARWSRCRLPRKRTAADFAVSARY